MSDDNNDLTIDASATKEFFIDILVRDISLTDAIVDLVDNSIDGAKRLRPKHDFTGLEVRIDYSKDHFRISDNCGGFDVEIARKYAFRFGRDKRNPTTPNSIGQFGVGMKRALFKMGNDITIESRTHKDSFVVKLNVVEWTKKPEDHWDLAFSELHEGETNAVEMCGTQIQVSALHQGVSSEFELAAFEARLRWLIETGHADSLSKGLSILVQNKSLTGPLSKLFGQGIKPVFREQTFDKGTKAPVLVRIYAGISDSNPSEAGWYIACNGRTILRGDQSITTGWGEDREATIPKYHNQFARFRGYVFFDSKDAGKLPWNTTKTDVDGDLPIYQAIRLEMISAMRPIIDFLNRLDAEKNAEEQPLTQLVEKSVPMRLDTVRLSEVFSYEISRPRQVTERLSRIQYSKPEKIVKEVKESLGVSTLTAVGEKTFDYYYNLECKD